MSRRERVDHAIALDLLDLAERYAGLAAEHFAECGCDDLRKAAVELEQAAVDLFNTALEHEHRPMGDRP
jgi:hypothetical protein